jgi:hypothetical protein
MLYYTCTNSLLLVKTKFCGAILGIAKYKINISCKNKFVLEVGIQLVRMPAWPLAMEHSKGCGMGMAQAQAQAQAQAM